MHCGDEFGLKLTGREHLTLYYDSEEELGSWQDFRGFFSSSWAQSRIKSVTFTLS